MSNFKEDILEAASPETIERIVIGDIGWGNNEQGKPPYKHLIGKVLTWDEAEKVLDYEYDDGYGSPDCQAIVAYTKTRVLYIDEYDGSTSITSVPRNWETLPNNYVPTM